MWEYLKRSKKYKLFCETFSGMPPMDILASDKLSTFAKKQKIKYQVFVNYYSSLGDIHHLDFNDWWEENNQHLTSSEIVVSDLSMDRKFHSNLTTYILHIIYQFRNKTVFSSDDIFKINKSIKDYFLSADADSIYLRLNIGKKINYKNFSNLIKKLIKERNNTRQVPLSTKSNRFRKSELIEYLRVLDLKNQGTTYKRIIKNIGTKKEKNDSDNREIWSSYARKVRLAKKIIKNIENGTFPGKYNDD